MISCCQWPLAQLSPRYPLSLDMGWWVRMRGFIYLFIFFEEK
jgi:hypothetical protein